MERKNELKESDIKNRACYYFNDIINGTDINFSNMLLDKKLYEIFKFIAFRIKLQRVQKHFVLESIMYYCNAFCIRIMVLDCKIKHLVLFGYGSFERICNKSK